MKKTVHKISRVLEGSIAEELEIRKGDQLILVNGKPVEDVFDYHFLIHDEYVELLILKEDGEEWELEIEKDYDEDLGIEFENSLMDEYRSCSNQCIFCFIDQMPKGMRETLYFKDDDSRLSFLQGNYVTLTNMSSHDIDRMIHYRLEPINISVHTMNPDLRCRMLHNRFAGEALKKIDRLCEAGIQMNGQIVLCKGVNDRKELEYSIEKLEQYVPCLQSVSIVPVGLTRYREGLETLEPFTKEDAKNVLEVIHQAQKRMMQKHGLHVIHAGDEWYLLAEEPIPEQERYDGYLQLENGVGMLRLLEEEVREELKRHKGDGRIHELSIATGFLAYEPLKKHVEHICRIYPNIRVHIYPIRNDFFGESITVSGLLTGGDLAKQLKEKKLGERLLLPCNILRTGEQVFLDDVTVTELERTLQTPINIVKSSGRDFVKAVLLEDGDVQHVHENEVNKYE